MRGGAFGFHPWALRAAHRSYYWPGPWEEGSYARGFRVVRELDDDAGGTDGADADGADGDGGPRP